MAHAAPEMPLIDRVRAQILSGARSPGERLPEVHLAGELGVKRGPLRDVFARLSAEGLLEATPNAGVRVAAAPTPFKRRVLVKLRRQLECDALEQAMDGDLDGLIATLDPNLHAFNSACRRGELAEVVPIDLAFHRALVEAAEDGALVSVWLPIICQIMLRYSRHTDLQESYREHRRIFDAICDRRRDDARELLRNHIV